MVDSSFRIAWKILVFLLLNGSGIPKGLAQCNGDTLSATDAYRVRTIRVKTILGNTPRKLETMLARHRGEWYRPTEQPETSGRDEEFELANPTGHASSGTSRIGYLRKVREYFRENDSDVALSWNVHQQDAVYAKVTYVVDCVSIIPVRDCQETLRDSLGNPVSRCVDIAIRVVVLPINTASLSANLFNLAHANKLGPYSGLPRPILALNPTLRIEHDRAFGLSGVGSLSTNLLALPASLSTNRVYKKNTQLRLSLAGSKSFTEPFYTTVSHLSLLRTKAWQWVKTLGLEVGFTANQAPQGEWQLVNKGLRIRTHTLVQPKSASFPQISFGAAYRRAANRLVGSGDVSSQRRLENAVASNLILDGRLAGGFVRSAVWFDAASVDKGSNTYQRAAVTVGYSKDIFLVGPRCKIKVNENGQEVCDFPRQNAPSLGLEVLLSRGQTWGGVPEYARFYGGNQQGSFLYDAANAPALAEFPSGPQIRSIGQQRAGARANPTTVIGGTSYWNVNLSLSMPLPRVSRPLIPAVAVKAEPTTAGRLTCDSCMSLKEMLKVQVESGKNIVRDALALKRLTPEQQRDLQLSVEDSLTREEEVRRVKAEDAFQKEQAHVTPEVHKLWKEITPMVNRVADRLNLYSIKPMVVLDAARLAARGELNPTTRIAVGGGLQFNLVVARFEIAYSRTVRSLPGDAPCNLTLRMIFERLL